MLRTANELSLSSNMVNLTLLYVFKSSARISLHLLPGFEFLKIKSVLYDTDNTPKNVPAYNESDLNQ